MGSGINLILSRKAGTGVVLASGESGQALSRFCRGWPSKTIDYSPASEVHLTRPGGTADVENN